MNMPTNPALETVEIIEAAAMQLTSSQRTHLVERLLISLETDDEILAAWIQEAERRADAYDRGEVGTTTLEAALSQARAGLPSESSA